MANGRIRFRGTLGLLLVLVPFLVYLAAEVSVMLMVIDTLGWWTVPVLILTT